ncbi:MAG TPA: IS5 family transposase [Blastocatellia bacterium]|nr:IS5 family transposase [Blastocatellia bacterium]
MTKKKKQQYRIRNWREYNRALTERGSLTLWIETRSTDTWLDQDTPARRGRRRRYTDAAITCALTLREVYRLPLRATQGLVGSILHLMQLELPSAHYSTLSRRARQLSIKLSAHCSKQIKHLVIDSSGLKVYGEGEWKVRVHGADRRRTWRKLHISMDAGAHQLTAASLTDKDELDRHQLPGLLEQTEAEVERVCADGAYDFEQCYRAIKRRQAVALIPPREDAIIRGKSPFEQRDENLRQIKSKGRKEWKKQSTYHQRSLGETAFFRLKTIFSDRLRSHRTDTQTTEAMVRCLALNRMTSLGMPESYAT